MGGAFGAGYSTVWTNAWSMNQRDAVILIKEDGKWNVYCKFSMDVPGADAEMKEMLKKLAAAPISTDAPTDAPTQKPTTSPTTAQPTKAGETKAPTEPPTESPSNAPTTQRPTQRPTQASGTMSGAISISKTTLTIIFCFAVAALLLAM